MTCPNAPEEHRDLDCVDGLVAWRGTDRRVPCGWCWSAAGYDAMSVKQVQALVAWRAALDEIIDAAQLTLDGDLERGRDFDQLCGRVRDVGVPDRYREAWLQWCRVREVPA